MAHSIKPPYPIFPLTPFSQSLYSSRASPRSSCSSAAPKRGEHPLRPPRGFALLLFSVAPLVPFNLRRSISLSSLLPLLAVAPYPTDRHHANLFPFPSSSRRFRRLPALPFVDAARFARLRGFRQERPTKTALTDARRTFCQSLHPG